MSSPEIRGEPILLGSYLGFLKARYRVVVRVISGLSVAPPKRNFLSLGVPEKIGDGFHGQKEPVGPVRQRKKVEVLVKADSFLVNGINDNYFAPGTSSGLDDGPEGEYEKLAPKTLSLQRGVQSQLRQQDRGDEPGSPSSDSSRCLVTIDEVGCDGEVPNDRLFLIDEKVGTSALSRGSLCVVGQPAVQLRIATIESSEFLISKGFDSVAHLDWTRPRRLTCSTALASRGAAPGLSSAFSSSSK